MKHMKIWKLTYELVKEENDEELAAELEEELTELIQKD